MSKPQTLTASPNATSLRALVDGAMHWLSLIGPPTDLSGLVAAPVSPSHTPAKRKRRTTRGTFGRSSTVLSLPGAPRSSLENRLAALLDGRGSPECETIWSWQIMPSGPPIFRLLVLAPPTAGSGSGLWRTLMASDAAGGTRNNPTNRTTDMVSYQVRDAVSALWSTLRSSDGSKGAPGQTFTKGGTPLPAQVAALWATLTQRDYRYPNSADSQARRGEGKRGQQLPNEIAHLLGPTPPGSQGATGSSGALNPAFACWFMGYPAEWVKYAPSGTPSSRKLRKHLSEHGEDEI